MKKYVVLMFILAMTYLVLCAFGIAVTGSTSGLAEIGNASVLTAVLIMLFKRP
ncbi:hypothetical protein [Mycobacteroides chelonae]|uniref:hypothetical protein n=1 Tax=Mycobacteroides chelonae TaxID=1774 RepID=UPI0013F4EEB1|nr:hypothetical protein [Mycobacteroides chelonae]